MVYGIAKEKIIELLLICPSNSDTIVAELGLSSARGQLADMPCLAGAGWLAGLASPLTWIVFT